MIFQYNLPVNLIFGRGQISQLGTQAAKYGKRALVVTGRNSSKRSGLLDRALVLLREAGVDAVLFDEVEQNPLTDTAYKGAAITKDNGCDVVVGIGGGSIMDAAKAIAFISQNEGDINDYIFGRRASDKALPVVLVPTTCGTGSEGNGFAVLTNPETGDKKSLRCSAIIPKASIIDPELMPTMPKHILASVGFDALSHSMEAYLSAIAQPMTDLLALEGIRLLGQFLPKVYDDPSDMEAWERVSWASTLGGMVINTAGVVAPHGMEHPASGLRNIVHAGGLSALTPVVFEESVSGAPERFAAISRLLGGHGANDCAEAVRLLINRLGLPKTLGEQGVLESDVEWMAENCVKVSSPSLANHPVRFGVEDLKRLYRKAL